MGCPTTGSEALPNGSRLLRALTATDRHFDDGPRSHFIDLDPLFQIGRSVSE